MRWAAELRIGMSHHEARVLMNLAKRADDNGECYPSVDLIARDTESNKRSVREALRRLEFDHHAISVVMGGGRNRTTKYTINLGLKSTKEGLRPPFRGRQKEGLSSQKGGSETPQINHRINQESYPSGADALREGSKVVEEGNVERSERPDQPTVSAEAPLPRVDEHRSVPPAQRSERDATTATTTQTPRATQPDERTERDRRREAAEKRTRESAERQLAELRKSERKAEEPETIAIRPRQKSPQEKLADQILGTERNLQMLQDAGLPESAGAIAQLEAMLAELRAEAAQPVADLAVQQPDNVVTGALAVQGEPEPAAATLAVTQESNSAAASAEVIPFKPAQADLLPAQAPAADRPRPWSEGLAIYKALSGKADKAARSDVGSLLKRAKGPELLTEVLREAERHQPVDPYPWIIGAIDRRLKDGGTKPKQQTTAAEDDAWGIEQWCKEHGATLLPEAQYTYASYGNVLLGRSRWSLNGKRIHGDAKKVCYVAGLDRKLAADLAPLVQWLADGFTSDEICKRISGFAATIRANGEKPPTLRIFDSTVRGRKKENAA